MIYSSRIEVAHRHHCINFVLLLPHYSVYNNFYKNVIRSKRRGRERRKKSATIIQAKWLKRRSETPKATANRITNHIKSAEKSKKKHETNQNFSMPWQKQINILFVDFMVVACLQTFIYRFECDAMCCAVQCVSFLIRWNLLSFLFCVYCTTVLDRNRMESKNMCCKNKMFPWKKEHTELIDRMIGRRWATPIKSNSGIAKKKLCRIRKYTWPKKQQKLQQQHEKKNNEIIIIIVLMVGGRYLKLLDLIYWYFIPEATHCRRWMHVWECVISIRWFATWFIYYLTFYSVIIRYWCMPFKLSPSHTLILAVILWMRPVSIEIAMIKEMMDWRFFSLSTPKYDRY